MLAAILVAAGDSRRMGFDKLFATIAGRPVIAHTIHAFERAGCVGEIIVVARKDRLDEIKAIVRYGNFKKIRSIIPGGKHRQDSVRAGLDHLEADAKYVAVHDAARPLITTQQIERVFEQCRMQAAASLAEPISDTLKYADADLFVAGPVDRHQLFAMQTPQVFERHLIEDAYRAVYAENVSVTDEVSAVEWLGRKVILVPNQELNFKITYPRDLALAEFVLNQRLTPPSPTPMSSEVKLIKWEIDPDGTVVGVGLHDGYFYGVVEHDPGLIIYMKACTGEPRKIQLSGLTQLNVTDFWIGSIIGGVYLSPVANVSKLMWEKLFAGQIAAHDRESSLKKLIESARGRYFFALEATYGANVYAVCDEMEITEEAYFDRRDDTQNEGKSNV